MTDNNLSTQDMMHELEDVKAKLQTLEHYRWVVESSADFILLVDRDFTVQFVNRISEASDQVIGLNLLTMVAGDYTKTVTSALEAVFNGSSFASYRVPGAGSNGETRLYETRVTPVHQQDGIKTLVLTARDVTEQSQLAEELERVNAQSLDIIGAANTNGYFTRVNPAVQTMLGYTPEEIMAVPFFTLIHPDDQAATAAEVQRLSDEDIPSIQFENRYRCKDGSYKWLAWNSSPAINGILYVTARDVTAQKQAEENLNRLASIVEITSDLVGSAYPNGQAIYMNPAGRRMVGLLADADISRKGIPDFSPDWANQILFQEGIPTAMRDGVWTGETAMKHLNNTEIPVSQTVIVHRNSDGSPAFISTIARDISDQKRAAAERERLIQDLQAARRIAEENSRLKSEFLATMSHELRTPLNAIEGFTSIMMSKMGGAQYNDKTERYVSRVNVNSKRLLGLINDFLDLSRVEAGRLELARMPFSPTTLAQRWQEEIGVLAERKAITFEVNVDSDLPEIIYGDEESISKIGLNLLSNAIKFTEQGGVTLDLKRDHSEWRITVTDTGIGIPPHAREYVFEEFRQVDQTSKRKYGGTGLGLAIVQKYARAMGGMVTLQSELGHGSTFTVTLPLNISL